MIEPLMNPPRDSWARRAALLWTMVLSVLFPLAFLADDSIRILIKDHRDPILYNLMSLLTWLGKGWLMLLVAAGFYGVGIWKGRVKPRSVGVRALAALAGTAASVTVLKHLVGRPRPRLAEDGAVGWGPSYQDGHDSFPSGHTTTAFAMAAVLSYFYPAGRWIWYSTAVLVGITRVYVGAHFTSDVLGGAVLGVLIGVWASRLKVEILKS